MRDFRLPPWHKWNLRFSGLLQPPITNHTSPDIRPHPIDTWYFSTTISPVKLGPVGYCDTLAPNYFPMLTAWKTKDLSFSKFISYVGNTVKGIQGHKPTLFSTVFIPFFCQENNVTWKSTDRMHQRTAVIWDAVCVIRQCRDWWNLQKNDISVGGQMYKLGGWTIPRTADGSCWVTFWAAFN